MDKRINNLKKQIIKENMGRILSLNKDGVVEIDIKEEICIETTLEKGFYITKLICDEVTIMVVSNHFEDGEECRSDIRLFDLEDIDYYITGTLERLIIKTKTNK